MLREMDSRESDGISVTLSVDTDTMRPVISLDDVRTDLHAVFTVPADKALDAFHHPFTYAHSAKVA